MANVTFYEPAFDRFVNEPNGQVGQYLLNKGRRIELAAKQQVGVRTGALRSSIHLRHYRDPRSQYITVGSSLHYAKLHHEGTKPHLITPKERRGMLSFQSKGQRIVTHLVRHPGTPANRYLSDNLRLIR